MCYTTLYIQLHLDQHPKDFHQYIYMTVKLYNNYYHNYHSEYMNTTKCKLSTTLELLQEYNEVLSENYVDKKYKSANSNSSLRM